MYRTSSTDSTSLPAGSESETATAASVPHSVRAPEPVPPAPVRSKTLTLPSLTLLLFAVFASAGGQIMLKHGMKGAAATVGREGGSLAMRAATSPWVVLGLLVFAVSALAWMATLAKVPLSIAYPFNALGYLLIVLAGSTVLHERTSMWTWGGSLLVVIGLVTVMAGQQR